MSCIKDLTNKKFGKLTAKYRESINGKSYWYCLCDCGNPDLYRVRSDSLTSHRIGHCNQCTSQLYDLSGEYGIGYTSKGEEFYFDLEDYQKIKKWSWCISSNGYVITTDSEHKRVYMHRTIMNCNKDKIVDHINHNTIDNRKSNLRICTYSNNNMNKGLRQENTSGVSGVSWDKVSKKWRPQIMVDEKSIYLGTYSDFDEAVKVRKEAEEKYFGEYRFLGECNASQV